MADYGNHLIRKIVISTGVVTTLAGTGSSGSANGTGTSASFNYPAGITTDGTNLYVADRYNYLIRKIVISTGVVTTVAGTGSSGSANGTGTSASFDKPYGVTTDGTNLYVADYYNYLIRQDSYLNRCSNNSSRNRTPLVRQTAQVLQQVFIFPEGLLQMEQTYMWQNMVIT